MAAIDVWRCGWSDPASLANPSRPSFGSTRRDSWQLGFLRCRRQSERQDELFDNEVGEPRGRCFASKDETVEDKGWKERSNQLDVQAWRDLPPFYRALEDHSQYFSPSVCDLLKGGSQFFVVQDGGH